MSDHWFVVDVDLRESHRALDRAGSSAGDLDGGGAQTVPSNVSVVDVRLWWGPAAIGEFVVRAEELPLSARLLWIRFAELVSPLVLARMAPDGRGRPQYDGSPDLSSLWPSDPASGEDSAPLSGAMTEGFEAVAARLDRLLIPDICQRHDVDVVICTRNRGSDMTATLNAIVDQSVPARSIIIVDNNDRPAPELEALVDALDNGVYVHAPIPGLSVARNVGVRHARSEIIAFTDDDVVPHHDWLGRLVAPFSDASIASVTGLVLAADLDTPSSVYFQTSGGLGGSYLPLRFDDDFYRASLPRGVPVWRIGAGANMAVRRSSLVRVGGFDERLGAGASGCSEDSELWYRLLAAGEHCVNEPLAIVWHRHRESMADLRRQLHAYQRGHVSALVVQSDRHQHVGNRVRAFRQLPAHFARRGRWLLLHPRVGTASLYLAEVSGFVRGLGYFVQRGWRSEGTPPRIDP